MNYTWKWSLLPFGMHGNFLSAGSGLLFEHRNSDDLADRLNAVINDPTYLDRLVEGIPSVKYVKEEFEELEGNYPALLQTVSRGYDPVVYRDLLGLCPERFDGIIFSLI